MRIWNHDRRRASGVPDDNGPLGDEGFAVDRSGDTAQARAAARVAHETKRVAELEGREPLRRRLLAALAAGPTTPAALASRVDASKEAVSRQLKLLREA